MLEACRSVVAATLFYGTDLYHYVKKVNGKYGGRIMVRGIQTDMPTVASAELAAALVTTACEARPPASLFQSRTCERVAPAQEYHKLAAAAGLEKPVCKGLNLGLSVHVERDLVIKARSASVYQLDSLSVAQVQSKVRAVFAAGASGKKKLNKREQKDARSPCPSIIFPNRVDHPDRVR